jgi:hypothetical protein
MVVVASTGGEALPRACHTRYRWLPRWSHGDGSIAGVVIEPAAVLGSVGNGA